MRKAPSGERLRLLHLFAAQDRGLRYNRRTHRWLRVEDNGTLAPTRGTGMELAILMGFLAEPETEAALHDAVWMMDNRPFVYRHLAYLIMRDPDLSFWLIDDHPILGPAKEPSNPAS